MIAEDVGGTLDSRRKAGRLKPHLTLSRIDPPASVAALLDQRHLYDFSIAAVVLYRSQLGRGTAKYEEVARFALTGRR